MRLGLSPLVNAGDRPRLAIRTTRCPVTLEFLLAAKVARHRLLPCPMISIRRHCMTRMQSQLNKSRGTPLARKFRATLLCRRNYFQYSMFSTVLVFGGRRHRADICVLSHIFLCRSPSLISEPHSPAIGYSDCGRRALLRPL